MSSLSSSFSYKATDLTGLGLHSYVLMNLNYILKAVFPNAVTLGIRAATYEFGGDTLSPQNLGSRTPYMKAVQKVSCHVI